MKKERARGLEDNLVMILFLDMELKYKDYCTEYTKLQYMIDSELNNAYTFIKNTQPQTPKTRPWVVIKKEILDMCSKHNEARNKP